MDPVGLLIAQARGARAPPLGLLMWTYLPNYICACLAVLPSKIIMRLSRKVSRARELGSYRLVELIGRGGMGEVWKAEHQLFARPAAIKLIAGHGMLDGSRQIAARALPARGRGRRGAAIAAHDPALRFRHHPRPAAVLRHGAARGQRPRVAGRAAMGPSRRPGWRTSSARPATRSRRRTPAGMVHRDIKPANLHIGRVGLEYDFVKVLDFGLVKRRRPAGSGRTCG